MQKVHEADRGPLPGVVMWSQKGLEAGPAATTTQFSDINTPGGLQQGEPSPQLSSQCLPLSPQVGEIQIKCQLVASHQSQVRCCHPSVNYNKIDKDVLTSPGKQSRVI